MKKFLTLLLATVGAIALPLMAHATGPVGAIGEAISNAGNVGGIGGAISNAGFSGNTTNSTGTIEGIYRPLPELERSITSPISPELLDRYTNLGTGSNNTGTTLSGFTLTGIIHLTCTNQVGNVTFEIPCQGDTILFPNFQPGAAPAVTNLDDVKLDAMRAQFGETVASQANPLTRGEFLKIIIDSAGVNVGNVDMTELNKYSDVDNTTAYAAYVAYASKNRIVSGYSDGTFRPTGSITRDEAAKILMKSTKTPISRATPHTFADIEASNTLGIYVQAAYDSKLVNGINTRDGQLISGTRPLFAPKQTISKGELFKIVYNILHAR